MQIVLDASRLAAVLSIDSDRLLEPNPQPFRLQSSLTVVVPFGEYQSFRAEAGDLNKYLYSSDGNVLKEYYMNMARAVAKECYFAVKYHTAPTHIRHYFYGAPEKKPQGVASVDYRASLSSYMETLGFGIPANFPLIKDEWDYACLLAGSSRIPSVGEWNPALEGGM